MSKAYLTPAAKKLTPAKLAHGMKLQSGQNIGSAPTKPSAAGRTVPTTPGQRSRTAPGCIATNGTPKNSGAAPIMSGMRDRRGE